VKILVAERNSTNRAALEHYLDSLGLATQSAQDALTVIELLRAALDSGDPYEVVVLDSMLPGLNGRQLASVIRQDARFSALKLILLTAVGKKKAGAAAEQAAIDGYLTKPLGLSHLRECLTG